LTDTRDRTALPHAATGPDLLGHPRGLWVLAGTELWERISFHGMQAMLTLYLAGELLLPGRVEHIVGFARFRAVIESVTGPLAVQPLAAQIFGLYIGLIYFTPVIGGAIGDRLTGRRIAIIAGGLLMTAGHFALAFDESFLLALLLLILGAGLLRGNLSAQLKSLYADGDRREADAFQIYYMTIATGAFIAPLASGALAALYGWHVGFGFAGFGMLIGLIVYIAGARHLPPDRQRAAAAKRGALTRFERRRLIGLLAVWPLVMSYWIAQSQVWNVYNLWVRDHVDLMVAGFTMPVPWLQSLDGLAPAALSPCVILWWRWQARHGREPDLFGKLAIGCLVFSGGVGLLALAPLFEDGDARTPLLVPIAFHIVSNLGAVYFAPVTLALFAREAPPGLRGLMIGTQSLAVFAAGLISGRIGGLYDSWPPAEFWLLHAAIVGAAGIGFLVFRRGFALLFTGDAEGVIL
jgi:POT family proton-dependent oligopeptide transporter